MADARFNSQGENPRLYGVLPPVTEQYTRNGVVYRSDDPASIALMRRMNHEETDDAAGYVRAEGFLTQAEIARQIQVARRIQRRLRDMSETIDITGPGS